jgi:PIN domain nuclease of toxin-antitoxin system
MRYLLDTHVVLWAIKNEQLLSQHVKDILTDSRNELFVSLISEWEIAIKVSIGKLELNGTFQEVQTKIDELQFPVIGVKREHLSELLKLPHHHKDPFDRLLIAQAKAENLTIITSDSNFKNYDIQIIFN